MLTTGMVPALYEQDEKDGLANTVRNEVRAAGIVETPDNLWSFYVNKCRNNLHIVLAFSPIGDAFRDRLRKFPALINCCTIDWFMAWPEDALEMVARKFLEEIELDATIKKESINMCKYFHEYIRKLAEK
jgi:dynein heavy chain